MVLRGNMDNLNSRMTEGVITTKKERILPKVLRGKVAFPSIEGRWPLNMQSHPHVKHSQRNAAHQFKYRAVFSVNIRFQLSKTRVTEKR